MFAAFRSKFKECKSFVLALLCPAAEYVIKTTLLSVFRSFGIPREKILIKHAELYSFITTLTIVSLGALSIRYPVAGWVMVIIGTIRILQIFSLNFLFIYFNFRLFSRSVHDRERARWHFVAFAFTLIDLSLIYSFFYLFFNDIYGIFNTKALKFIDYLFLSVSTITTLGCNNIIPVKTLGKILIMSEVGIGIFLFAIIINAAMIHHHHLYESLEK